MWVMFEQVHLEPRERKRESKYNWRADRLSTYKSERFYFIIGLSCLSQLAAASLELCSRHHVSRTPFGFWVESWISWISESEMRGWEWES